MRRAGAQRDGGRRPLSGPVVFVLKGYPRLSETFIAQEIRALEARGLDIRIASLRHPTDPFRHPVHDEIAAPVHYLPEYLHQAPLRVLRAWWRARRQPGYRAALRAFLRDLARDRTPNRVRRFGQALVLAAEVVSRAGARRIHAHFVHTPGSVARYAALVEGIEWTASAHAKDIWTTPEWELREKLASSAFTVTCTAANRDHLRSLAPARARVSLVYHGLDLDRFARPPGRPSARAGKSAGDAVVLLSVGRAVEKKGYGDLLDALAGLPPGLHWRLVHVGAGPLAGALAERARALGVAGRVEWRGAQDQQTVLDLYREADLFVLASRVAADGDRDGLPNVLMEAQSQRLACVSTAISAIPELVEDGVTGLLVPERDPRALGAAIARLAADVPLRRRLASAGEARVRARFSLEHGADELASLFGLSVSGAREAEAAAAASA